MTLKPDLRRFVMDNHNKKQKEIKKKRTGGGSGEKQQNEIPPMNEDFKKQKEMYEDGGAGFTTAEIIDFSQGADS